MTTARYLALLVSNVLPNAPALGARSNFDATQAAVFPWTHSDDDGDTQVQREIEIRRTSDQVIVHESTASTATESYNLAGGTIAQNTDFQWRVRTADAEGFGPFSGWQAFSTSAAPVVTITNPAANGAVVNTASLDATWTSSDPVTAYRAVLNDGGGDIVDTGKVLGNILHHLFDGILQNGGAYTLTIYVWDDKDVMSAATIRTFTVTYTPPAIPLLTAIATGTTEPADFSHFIRVTIDNPVPVGAEPLVVSNDLYRRKDGETDWERIATGLANDAVYDDYAVAHEQLYEYLVTAFGDNGSARSSGVAEESINLQGVWIHVPNQAPGTEVQFVWDGRKSDESTQLEVEKVRVKGRTYPVAIFGDGEEYTVRQTLQLLNAQPQYESLYEAFMRKTVLLYRDNRGRKVFGIISGLPKDDGFVVSETTITVDAIDYSETV